MSELKFKLPKLHPKFVFQIMDNEVYNWGAIDLNIPEIHKQTMGENIKIAILDSGKSEHFETINNTIAYTNLTTDQNIQDKMGHSTFCAGIIAAEKNDQGIIGAAPKAKLLFAKCIEDAGTGSPAALTKGVMWAIEQQVDIISISAGMFIDFKPLHQAIQLATNKNIIVIAAAGNTGVQQFDVAYPARYPEVIGVAAYDKDRKITPFSSRGINVKFAMPGKDIYSTWPGNQYCSMSGTCLTKKSMVYTTKGPVSISLLNPGDVVYSVNDSCEITTNKVIHQWSRGIKNCWSIKTKHRDIEATNNHPILTNINGNFEWKTVSELKIGDLIVCANGIPTEISEIQIKPKDEWNVSILKPIKPNRGDITKIGADLEYSSIRGFLSGSHGLRMALARPILQYYNIPIENMKFGVGKKHKKISIPQMSTDLSYLCGFYLGDGWITKPKSINRDKLGSRLYFAKTNRAEVNIKLCTSFKNVFLVEPNERKNFQYEICNTVIADIFEQLCGYKKAKDKSIPSWIYSQNKNIIKAFISGLIDSDGWVSRDGYGFSSCSEAMTSGLAYLLDYVGFRRRNIYYRQRKIKAPNSISAKITHEYSVDFRAENLTSAKQHKNCQNKFEPYASISTITQLRTEKISEISYIGEHEIFDIEVENNHNFIANNIVVHNSFSCPLLAGVCALILAKHKLNPNSSTPCTNYSQMIEHLKKYSINLGPQQEAGFGTIDLTKLINEEK